MHTFKDTSHSECILRKTDLKAYQASKRGGELDLKVTGDRILISGEAVTVIDGKMRVPNEPEDNV